MLHSDKNITCRDCNEEFVFTAGEQAFYAEKGFENEPARCPSCRQTRRRNKTGRGERQMYTVTCSDCGNDAEVPFNPTGDRPVYCRECFTKE